MVNKANMPAQIEIQWRLIHPHPSWSDASTDPFVWIEPTKFDTFWRQGDQWVGPGGMPGGQGERYPRAGQWLLAGNPTDMCQIWVNDEGVGFNDGRHGFAWLRDHGVAAIPVQLSPDSLALGVAEFETEILTSILAIQSGPAGV